MQGYLYRLKQSHAYILTAILVAILVSLVAGGVVVYYMLAGSAKGMPGSLSRISNTLAFLVAGAKPHFYYIEGEKNGKEFRLTAGDVFSVTYRDEFVFKNISTDAFSSSRISLSIEGMERESCFRVLLKGIDLVDLAVRKGSTVPFQIVVRYDKEVIAAIPVKVEIAAQDWLRYAKETQDTRTKIEYLKKAIAINTQDVNVRHMLIGLYLKAGMKEEASAQQRELAALRGGERKPVVGKEPKQSDAASARKNRSKPPEKKHEETAAAKRSALEKKYLRLGDAYEKKGNLREALNAYSKAYQLNPRSEKAGEKIPQLKIKMLKNKYKEDEG